MKLRTIANIRERVRLIERGNHETLGVWTAAQNFYHLAAAFEATIEQWPAGSQAVTRKAPKPIRWFITRVWFPPFISIPESIRARLEPPTDADFATQKVRLLENIDRFQDFEGEHPPHPVLGPLSRDQWIGFHVRHSQRHLSFIAVKSS